MSKLFSPIKIGSQSFDNRIVIPPMCQYSAKNGLAGDWHLMHYGALSHSGAALMVLEATAVCPEGRLSPFDLGLWGDEQQQAMKVLISSIRQYSSMPIAVQLVHAGRKASMPAPWQEEKYVPVSQGGWQTVAPSALAFNVNYNTPLELTTAQVKDLVKQFADAAVRADKAGIDVIEIHAAHGYLIHQFLSPLSNSRTDQYGGSAENRMRFAIEIFEAIRAVFPKHKGVGIRISATDWVDGGWNLAESILLAKKLDQLGCSYIHVSTGGIDIQQQIPVGPNYQVPFAQAIKQQVGMPVIAVGLITDAIQAEAIVSTGQADMVAIGRDMLFNPHWPWQAAKELGAKVIVPPQYGRSAPHGAKNLFK
ncbi:2,4-dienoyl-CoA reductase-like NADH-dependent reductase (Old Yellow Enzyme family) [Orbus hercynius]|uniref:2,4-dienoyl-CoA reductase-like NADH-dependent reductase (Old Yellow Enzyme family) n=1 Tax=Orbus hercynius TaxID=593135 RepID=A0A495REC2_9GAMM|nr:NADH:flavin oxidoreductase/NADH oxidase [Orbus hercynius]RKS85832.1 2,4-dienoyl-CoA reductase-like NADH-dependent reductase (Old Yellow Enzyme family) [Orbus hercynius]